MHPIPVFVFQLWWSILCWSLIAYFVIWPWAARLPLRDRLSLFVAPEMFRVLGAGLLVENLSPGMPLEFSASTAIGDTLTASLALAAFVALRREAKVGRALTWAATVVGMADLLIAFPHAVKTSAIDHMGAQWFVPVVAGPIMVVAHVCCLITLIRARRAPLDQGA
jgi:hypothetical protein